ncbi:MAG: type II toxin-antitoxin system prevent-host-death family antitoxin [Acidobacteriota bacterium]|jgi:antitoxin YefM|nr:type II toxin-antitoxin system prevent-host-death family antitoxin [Acidobacteriota bacterium]
MNTTTISSAKKNLESLIEQVENDAEPTLIIVDENRKAVLISESEYNSWQETIYLLSNPANAEHLRKSLAEAENGDVKERELIEI